MPKRKYSKPKLRRSRRYSPVRRSKPKIPMEMLMTGIAIPFTSPADNWTGSPISKMQEGKFDEVMHHLSRGFVGLDPSTGQINLMRTLNPFDMGEARYWKMLFWGAIVGKVRKKVAPQSSKLFKKIPLIGNYIS